MCKLAGQLEDERHQGESLAEIDALAQAPSRARLTSGLSAGDAAVRGRWTAPRRGSPSGAQDCHPRHRAPIPAISRASCWPMPGPPRVILGHSERRENHHETNALVRDKAMAAQACGAHGGDLHRRIARQQREGGQTLQVIGEQLAQSCPEDATAANTVIAYEPVWAIGTGLVPETGQIAEVHDFLRASLVERFGAAARRDPSALWRVGQARQRRGDLRRDQRRRRARRRGQPAGGGFLAHHQCRLEDAGFF